MTAVLQATDALRNERLTLGSDDMNFSSGTDWKAKYFEVADMLAETRAELDDFQMSSKELEEELERELERTEKAQQDLKIKAAKAEQEKDEWKSKFMSLQTTHNTTTASLQKELDTLRKEHQQTKVQLRELEMGNDDLERNERAISSSLADIEQKYSRVLEEKILLEHELLDKAHLEEECQRFKDELRDANEEISILRDQLAAARDRAPVEIPPSTPSATSQCASEDDASLPSTPAQHGLPLSDLFPPATPGKDLPPIITTTPRTTEAAISSSGQASLLYRAGVHSRTAAQGVSSLVRSSTVPVSSSSRTPSIRPPVTRNVSSAATTNTAGAVPGTTAKSKGVQMVSEMRARVKVLEQKIHTRVPRIRMGSVTNRITTNPVSSLSLPQAGPSSTTSPITSTSTSSLSARSSSPDKTITFKPRRQSIDQFDENTRTPVGDTSGWVLIMEDSPSPLKNKDKERHRMSGGANAPSAYRALSMSSASPTPSESRSPSALSQTNAPVRRPQSRLSVSTEGRSSISTNATTSTASSIPTPSSRPSTPTFLPVPTSGLYHSTIEMKKSTGPTAPSGGNTIPKRSSFGSSRPSPQPLSLAASPSTATVRPKLGSPAFGHSRIGRSSYGHGGRKTGSAGVTDDEHPSTGPNGRGGRGRASSSSTLFGRGY